MAGWTTQKELLRMEIKQREEEGCDVRGFAERFARLGADPAAVESLYDELMALPIAPDFPYLEIARQYEAAGADALSLINTLMGMAIDAERRKPVLARVVGGFSGPAVKPVALRMVWECHKAVKVPLLGMGGICTGTDAVEFMLAGATAVAVGTANFMNPAAGRDVVEGIRAYCEEQGVDDVNELIGGLQC